MLLVKTEVRESPIAGVGLFAMENIKKGQLTWRYQPESCVILTEQQLKEFSASFHKGDHALMEYFSTYAYFVSQINGIVVCLDNGRYVNHSESPNMGSIIGLEKVPNAWQTSYAHRDIEKGEELTESYSLYDTSPWWNEMCRERNSYYTACC